MFDNVPVAILSLAAQAERVQLQKVWLLAKVQDLLRSPTVG